jgi:hypothetical protein
MGAQVVTVNDVLDGHVALDIQCLDRIYLNAYVPRLQTSAQVVAFLSGHLGYPFPSPALFNQIGQRFRRAVASYAQANDIPWVAFGKDDDKLAVMRATLTARPPPGPPGWLRSVWRRSSSGSGLPRRARLPLARHGGRSTRPTVG